MARGGSKAAATSKMECFVIIVSRWKPLTIITKNSIWNVAVALDPPLNGCFFPKVCPKIQSKDKQKKNLQLEPLEKKYSDLLEELALKEMSPSYIRSTFGLAQTKKLCNGRRKYHKF